MQTFLTKMVTIIIKNKNKIPKRMFYIHKLNKKMLILNFIQKKDNMQIGQKVKKKLNQSK